MQTFKLPPRPQGEAATHKSGTRHSLSEKQINRAEHAQWERVRLREGDALFMDPVRAAVHEPATVSAPGVWRTALQYIARTVGTEAAQQVMPL